MKQMKKWIFLALLLAAAAVFGSCTGGNGETPTEPQDTVSSDVESGTEDDNTVDLWLMKDGEGIYIVTRGDGVSKTQVDAAVYFNTTAREKTGKPLSIQDDYILPKKPYDPLSKEILIGSTKREESRALEAKLGRGQFAITTGESKIVIVASRDSLLKMAVDYFFANFVTVAENGSLSAMRDVEYFSEEGMKANGNILSLAGNLTSDSEKLFSIAAPSASIKTPQGGYCDGQYYYQLYIQRDYDNNEQNNVDRIVKYDMKTGKVVKTSGDLPLNHGNDIAYNPKINKLLVVHNNPNRTYVSLIDPDTLELVETKKLPCSIYCLDYNEAKDLYVVGVSGGQDFRFLNPDFTVNGSIHTATTLTAGYVTQGMSCDDDYIYFVLYKENVVTVYDWTGKFVTVVHFDVGSIEPENISVVDGEILVGCAQSGISVYRITPKEYDE